MYSNNGARGLWIAAAIGATAMLAACSNADGRKAEFMQRGNQFYAQENYDKARLEYKNVLQIDPKHVEALYQLGLLEELAQNWRAAAGDFQRVIELDEKNVKARVHLGKLYLLSGAPDKALELADEALKINGNDADVLMLKAGVLAKQQQRDEAEAMAQQALALNPSHAEATILLAGLERVNGNPKQALELLQQGISVNPKHLGLKFVMAEILGEQGNFAQGAQVLRDVIALKPEVLSHRLRLASYLEAGKDYTQAEAVLREAVTRDDEQAQARLALVNFIHAHGAAEQAAKQLQNFIAKDPKAYGLQFSYAGERERAGKANEAMETYRAVIASADETPAGLIARARLARLLALEGKNTEAEGLIAEVLKKNATDGEALMVRAGLFLTKRDAASAVVDLRNLLRDQPDHVQALKVLAQAHALNKEEDLAVETLHKAVALVPDDIGVRLSLAELLARQSKIDEAKPQIEHILKRDANQAQALEAMFKLQLAAKDWSAALATATKFGKAYPEQARGDYFTGVALEAQGKVPAAIASYRKAINKRPNAVEPLTAIVKAYLSQRQLREGLSVLDETLKRDPRNFVAQNLRGEVLLLAGNSADAEESFSAAIELNPKVPTAYRNLGSARLARNDVAGAVKAYETGLKQIPDNDMLMYSIAAVDERQGRHDRAIARYEELLKRKPQSELAKNNLAMLLVTHRNDHDSLNRARDLVQELGASDEPAYLDTVGWVHYRRGEVDQAVSVLEQALQKVPSAPLIHYHLGMAYFTKGNVESAQQHLEKALETKAQFDGINDARATLNKLKNS